MPKLNTCGHPERKHHAKGMCHACYMREYDADPARRERKREYMREYNADPARRERERERNADPARRERKREYYQIKKAAKCKSK